MAQYPDGPDVGAPDPSGPAELAARIVKVKYAAQDLGIFIRAQREAAQVSLRQLALLAGVSNPYLSQIERGLRKPSAQVLGRIAKGLRVSAQTLYLRAGYLDEQRPSSTVRDALLADAAVSERHKQVLLDIYDAFCRENDPTHHERALADAAELPAEPQPPRAGERS